MTRDQLIEQIRKKKSYLCVGLDTDITKIPAHLRSHTDAVFEFNKQIIDATHDLCVAYKINTAFYEATGAKGWEAMEKTVNYIPKEIFTIADAKRGDIGNTSSQYAKAFFETLHFDAVTVAPYMGEDSIKPFLEYKNKWTIVLGLTSNAGSKDFEQLRVLGRAGVVGRETNNGDNSGESVVGQETNNGDGDGEEFLYEKVLRVVSEWGNQGNLMFVTGATKASDLQRIRNIIPDHFLLVPGVGAQGGNLAEVSQYGLNKDCGLLVNVSRGIIYVGSGKDFAEAARKVAAKYVKEMGECFKTYHAF